MKLDNELDSLFSREQAIVPSSGFTEAVMGAVRTEAFEPPPIPFPWRRAIPGLASVILVIVSYVIAILSKRTETGAEASVYFHSWSSALNTIVAELLRTDIQMIFITLVLTFVVAKLSMRIHSERQ